MRIIFLSDVPGSGVAGEVKEVKNGYARNYLLPKKLATLANHDQLQRLAAIKKTGEERRLKEEQELKALVGLLSETALSLSARIGPMGKFYGAVTSVHVAEELNRLTGRDFDRRFVQLDKPIQEPGEYQAELRFPQGLVATIKLTVVGKDAQGRAIGPSGEVAQAQPVPAQSPAEGDAAPAPETATPADVQEPAQA
ncbi:MAG: 50S ribosomal protein L9 [Chloroflexi bacterium]|nr:50S ribosomal protein L9 [Chloroflexota bacterium]